MYDSGLLKQVQAKFILCSESICYIMTLLIPSYH